MDINNTYANRIDTIINLQSGVATAVYDYNYDKSFNISQ